MRGCEALRTRNHAPPTLLAHAALSPHRSSLWSDGWTFFFALLSICPLAERLGFITEQLALYTNSTVGGLLNATFGNATEAIVSLFAMRAGLLRVVQLSLLGSILSNMLLVLGCAFLFGGLRYPEQRFNVSAASMNVNLLVLALLAQALPSLLAASHTELRGGASVLTLSRVTSLVLVCLYAAFLYFQLVTHAELFDDEAKGDKKQDVGSADAAAVTEKSTDGVADDEEDEEEEKMLTFSACLGALTVVTLLISLLSDYLVDAIQGAAESWDLPLSFIAVILLPIVGNAAEHASAIIFARKNKMDIALGIAIGSSTQIAIGVTPACVLLGGLMGKPLSLDLQPFETGAMLVSVLCLAHSLQDGRSNWMKGATLCAGYVLLAAAFAVHDDPLLAAERRTEAVSGKP